MDAAMDPGASTEEHVQIRLFSKLPKYAEVEATLSIPSDADCAKLTQLVQALVKSKELEDEDAEQDFDFLVRSELLRGTILALMEQRDISTESVVDVEFILKQSSPTPEQSILHNDWVSCVQANHKYVLSGCYDNTVKIHSFTGEELLTLPAHTAPVRCLSWISTNGDEEMFVTGSHDQLLHVWKWNSGNGQIACLFKCAGHAFSVEAVTVSPDRLQFASVSRDSMLKIWTLDDRGVHIEESEDDMPVKRRKYNEAQTKVPIITLSGHHEGAVAVCWNAPGDLVTAGLDHTIRLWNLESQSNTQTIKSSKALLCLDCSPLSGKFVTGSSDRHVRLWDSRVHDSSMVIGNFTSHTGWVSSVKWSKKEEHLFISGSYDGLTKLWDIRSPKTPLYDMGGHSDKVLSVDWSYHPLIISGGADNALNMFNYKS